MNVTGGNRAPAAIAIAAAAAAAAKFVAAGQCSPPKAGVEEGARRTTGRREAAGRAAAVGVAGRRPRRASSGTSPRLVAVRSPVTERDGALRGRRGSIVPAPTGAQTAPSAVVARSTGRGAGVGTGLTRTTATTPTMSSIRSSRVLKSDCQIRRDNRRYAQRFGGGWRWSLRRPSANCRSFQLALFEAVGLAEPPGSVASRAGVAPSCTPCVG